MKSDREFLDGMWQKVLQEEYDEMQKRAAKIRHRKIIAENTALFLSIITAFVFFIMEKPAIFETYIIAVISLVSAYLLDMFISGEINKNKNKSKSKKLF